MFEKQKIQEAYVNSILSESSESQVSSTIAKVFPNVKVKKVDVKRKIIFHLSDFVDEGDFDNSYTCYRVHRFNLKEEL